MFELNSKEYMLLFPQLSLAAKLIRSGGHYEAQ